MQLFINLGMFRVCCMEVEFHASSFAFYFSTNSEYWDTLRFVLLWYLVIRQFRLRSFGTLRFKKNRCMMALGRGLLFSGQPHESQPHVLFTTPQPSLLIL
jgi:hypothetical protein